MSEFSAIILNNKSPSAPSSGAESGALSDLKTAIKKLKPNVTYGDVALKMFPGLLGKLVKEYEGVRKDRNKKQIDEKKNIQVTKTEEQSKVKTLAKTKKDDDFLIEIVFGIYETVTDIKDLLKTSEMQKLRDRESEIEASRVKKVRNMASGGMFSASGGMLAGSVESGLDNKKTNPFSVLFDTITGSLFSGIIGGAGLGVGAALAGRFFKKPPKTDLPDGKAPKTDLPDKAPKTNKPGFLRRSLSKVPGISKTRYGKALTAAGGLTGLAAAAKESVTKAKPNVLGALGKTTRTLGRGLGVAATPAFAVMDYNLNREAGMERGEAAGRAAGSAGGAAAGAVIGSFVPIPVVGTVVGAVVGEQVGAATVDLAIAMKRENESIKESIAGMSESMAREKTFSRAISLKQYEEQKKNLIKMFTKDNTDGLSKKQIEEKAVQRLKDLNVQIMDSKDTFTQNANRGISESAMQRTVMQNQNASPNVVVSAPSVNNNIDSRTNNTMIIPPNERNKEMHVSNNRGSMFAIFD